MKKILAVALLLTGVITVSFPILAQNSAGAGQALEVSPPVKTLTADPGQTINTEISIRNVSNVDLIVSGQINDFVASGEDGTPKILLDEEDDENPYSFKEWVDPFTDLLLVPREIKILPITINVPVNASPGGHYGVIRFTGGAPELDETGVALSASLGTLMLITVTGETEEKLEIEEFSINQNGVSGTSFQSAPLQFVERLRNTGNNHLLPSGQVIIKDMFGKKVAALNVNLPPRNILPQSIRRFEQPLDNTVIGNKRLFGRYTADMQITYGADDQTLTQSITFWIIPYKLIGLIIGGLIIGFIALRFLLQRYNRYIVEKAKR